MQYSHKGNTCIVQKEWFSVEQCRANPDYIYVFGDNNYRKGKGGQAIIRDEPNTFGITTKRKPSQEMFSFMADSFEDLYNTLVDLTKLHELYLSGKTIVLPADGLGTGLAELQKRSPRNYKQIVEFINRNILINDT